MRKFFSPVILAISWFVISTILLSLPGTSFPKEDWLDKIWFDKWVHIGIFSVLVILWCLAWKTIKKDRFPEKLLKVFIAIGLIWTGYGIIMEFIQLYFIPYRSFDFGDIVADAVGCGTGVIFSSRKYIKK